MPNTTITKAAIKIEGKVYTGYRHAAIMEKIWEEKPRTNIRQEYQGFLTSEGEFVNRSKAATIAFKAGQIDKDNGHLDSYQVFPSK